jgi:hypothetical protein
MYFFQVAKADDLFGWTQSSALTEHSDPALRSRVFFAHAHKTPSSVTQIIVR